MLFLFFIYFSHFYKSSYRHVIKHSSMPKIRFDSTQQFENHTCYRRSGTKSPTMENWFSHFHFQRFPREKFTNQQKLFGLFRSKSGAKKHIVAFESLVLQMACHCLSSELQKRLALWLKCQKGHFPDWLSATREKKSDWRTLEGFNELSWTIVWRTFYRFS